MQAEIEAGHLVVRGADGRELLRATADVRLSDGTLVASAQPAGPSWHVATSEAGLVLRLRWRHETGAPAQVEQLRPLVAERGYRGLPLDALRISSTGWQSWSRSHLPAPFQPNREIAAPPIRGPVLPRRLANSQAEPWMTILSPASDADADQPSLLLGFLSARDQLGTIEIAPTREGHAVIAATELEGIPLAPGSEIVSEPLLLREGTEPDLLQHYAHAVAEAMQARPIADVLSGWCSWYQLYTTVSEADVRRNLATLSNRKHALPLKLIQLDDGYQHAVGDWLELNDKFTSGMPALVREIREKGFTPGLWLAPFLLSANSHTYQNHPEWVMRDDTGEPLNALNNWGAANYCLDPTHPEAMAWLLDVIRTTCEDWGYEYLKLDFLYAAALRGRRHDPTLTSVQAYHQAMLRIREAMGDRFMLGCGAPLLPSIGVADGMRIGSDVAAYWGDEGNSDGPALRNATRATLARGWMHGHWWANDPDCVIVRGTDTQLSLGEVQAWAAVVALSGGMLFVGDDVSRVEPERLALLSRLFPPSGEAADALPPLVNRMPSRLRLRIDRPWGSWCVAAVANWLESAAPVTLEPAAFGVAGRYHAVDLWTGEYLGAHDGPLELGALEPHAMRVLAIHLDHRRPQVVGSTGHLLGDAMDLASESWDPATRTLRLSLSVNAPDARCGELLVVDEHGALQRVPFTGADREPIELRFA